MSDEARPSPRPDDDHVALLAPGDHGPQVADLQARLLAAGQQVDDQPGVYGEGTEKAVRSFQEQRGLSPEGTCDHHTWAVLVEAGYRLGDRPLVRTSPMLRGDDVAELQRRLSAFGFDTGRIDGIFGDQTAAALVEFQRNTGQFPDGICGRRTIVELRRLSLHEQTSELVSRVREQLRLDRHPPGLVGRRIAVAERGGFAAGLAAVCRALADAGAIPLPLQHPDPSRQAAEANAAEVDCVISLVLDPDRRGCATAYYRGFRYESAVSRRLAELIQAELPGVLAVEDAGTHGMALPLLRETRMPAVDLRLGAPVVVVQHTAEMAQVIVRALTRWATERS